MQLVGRVHEREAWLELENEADVSELEVGVDQGDLLVLEAGKKHCQIGGDDGLAGSALGAHDDDDLTFVLVGRDLERPPRPCA